MTDTETPVTETPVPHLRWTVTRRPSSAPPTPDDAVAPCHELPTQPLLVVDSPGHACRRTCTGCAIVLAVSRTLDTAADC